MKSLRIIGIIIFLCTFLAVNIACGAATSTPAPTQTNATIAPTRAATSIPTTAPTNAPTGVPTIAATDVPTRVEATNTPTAIPSSPTAVPSSPTAMPQPTSTPIVSTPNDSFTLDIEPIVDGLRRPIFVGNAGDGSNRLFLVEQPGRIFVFENGKQLATPFLDLSDKVTTDGNEEGLLGLAFHPDYKNNGLFFVNYSRKGDGDNVIERYRVSSDPNVADANSAKTILTIPGLEPNHNGGMLAFGRDGYLYIATGDGGGAGDKHGTIGNGQSLNTLLGKILRIDVNADTYRVPADNPFVNTPNALPEIWAYGLRNPWRFSFDRATGDLYIADVGQSSYEEVNFQPASSKGGENYGWRIMEGAHCYNETDGECDTTGLVLPIAEYTHDLGCSITGGYVYRGKLFPWLVGQYIFADYCTGVVWATARDANGVWQTRRVTTFDDTISSFGEDELGELYVAGHKSGTIYKLTSAQ